MRKTPILLGVLAATALAPGAGVAQAARTTYFVSVGDSLAAGSQLDAAGKLVRAKRDYTAIAFAKAAKHHPKLKLKRFGCPGDNTSTFQYGGCREARTAAQKLAQAKRAGKFMGRHRGRIAYVTLSIGAGDFTACARPAGLDAACAAKGLDKLKLDLPGIDANLRLAAGKRTRIVQLLPYNPYVTTYLNGDQASIDAATASDALARDVNRAIVVTGRKSGFRFADGYAAFASGDLAHTTTLEDGRTVPVAVVKACELTQQCLPAPQAGVLPTDAGYKALAKAVIKALRL
jgi:hypothetical protein